MSKKSIHGKSLTVSILSLSLLMVMAGAVVVLALSVIREHFADSNQLFVQMITSVPALFIVNTNFIFSKLCKMLVAKTLVFIGLLFYTAGGCAAGLSSYYFRVEQQVGLMGYSSAMNQMGGVIATLLLGLLANISWRVSFLVYLMGLISIVLCMIYLPNDKITQEAPADADGEKQISSGNVSVFQANIVCILAMFLLMSTFLSILRTLRWRLLQRNYSTAIYRGYHGGHGLYRFLRRSTVRKC